MSRIPACYTAPDGETYKFQDCVACVFRRSREACGVCTNGEMFEPEDERTALDFSDDNLPPRSWR